MVGTLDLRALQAEIRGQQRAARQHVRQAEQPCATCVQDLAQTRLIYPLINHHLLNNLSICFCLPVTFHCHFETIFLKKIFELSLKRIQIQSVHKW